MTYTLSCMKTLTQTRHYKTQILIFVKVIKPYTGILILMEIFNSIVRSTYFPIHSKCLQINFCYEPEIFLIPCNKYCSILQLSLKSNHILFDKNQLT